MTQEQYMQLMSQRQQQRQPSPEQQAMMMQQQMMAEQQSAPGAAGGFMGGLLDSALAGLVPNSMYQNPNDPNNVSASKAGGLIGMIIPMLLAKYGIKNFALPALAKEGSALGRWLGAGTEAAASTQNLARADMLASILGGGIGGGLAEGPMGGLLGAAGLGAYSKFAGAGKLMREGETYGFSKLFEGGNKVKPVSAKDAKIAKKVEEGRVTVPEEELKVFKSDVESFYDKTTGTVDMKPIVNYSKSGFDEYQFGVAKSGDKLEYITPRDLIENAATKGNETVTIRKATQQKVETTVNGKKKIDTTPKYGDEETKTWSELLDEYTAIGKTKLKKGYTYNIFESAVYGAKNNPFKQGNGGFERITKLETDLAKAHKLPLVPKEATTLYGGRPRFSHPKPTQSSSTSIDEKLKNAKEVSTTQSDIDDLREMGIPAKMP